MRATIEYENQYGKVKTITKDFDNKKHIDNYARKLMREGNLNIEVYIDK